MTLVKVTVDYLYTLPTERGGINRDTYADFQAWDRNAEGVSSITVDDTSRMATDPDHGPTIVYVPTWYFENTAPGAKVPLDSADLWLNTADAELENYLVYFELDDPTKVCPYSATNETWNEWEVSGKSGVPRQLGQFWYKSNQAFVSNQGVLVAGTVWKGDIKNPNTNQTGIERMISEMEYQEIVEANTPSPTAQSAGRGQPRRRGRR